MAIDRIRIDEGTTVLNFAGRPGVYFLYSGSELLYVGQSKNIKLRMCAHLGFLVTRVGKGKCKAQEEFRSIRGTKIRFDTPNDEYRGFPQIALTVDYVEVLYLPKNNIKKVESHYIRKFNPPFNKTENKMYKDQIETRNFYRALSNVFHENYDAKFYGIGDMIDTPHILVRMSEILEEAC